LTFAILGPLEVRDGEHLIPLPRRKHRALLVVLLLRAGEVVSTDSLIDQLWGESPPRTAKEALVNYVSLLRHALGPDVVITRAPGYILDASPEQTDLARFERLTAESRAVASPAARAGRLREALALWRGPPFADIAYEPFAAVEIARLDELRLAATEDLIDAELELGRHIDLVPEIETLIREHPFDERLRGQLMLALYRGGRQAEALDAYQATRRVLDEELGLEPGPPLRELEQAILRHDASLHAASTPTSRPSRRTVTVLVAGHPAADERDPETVAVELTALRIAAERHGGMVGRFAGDAAMAVFGSPQMHEDDALRAVRAAAELRAVLPELKVGVATGEVFADDEGIAGTPVTLARQLEQAAGTGEVLIAAPTLGLVREAIRGRRVSRGDLAAFALRGVVEGAPGIRRRLRRPLVDREAELEQLRSAFETARDEGRCIVFTGFGEAGMGKTRLARELIVQVRHEATVLVGRCASYGEGATFRALREMIDDFDDLVGSAGSTGELFLAARRRFEGLAAERPLLLLFEDVHWAEPTLLDLIEYLGTHSTGPILALCLSRPDLLAERVGWSAVGPSLVLEPLSDDHARQLVGDSPTADRIVEIAEGNPLYVEQLVASVEEAGVEALAAVPASVEALLASRLDRLGPAERAVAQRAAVVGRRFSPAAVAALGPTDALPDLEQGGFIHRAGTLYRFHHVLVRDVVYGGTPKVERAKLHRLHAEWLEDREEGPDELVGYHFEQAAGYLGQLGSAAEEAELAAEAGRRLGAAGIRAWKRGDARTAIGLFERAVALLPKRDPFRLELMCELGGALLTAGGFVRAEEVLMSAREEAAAADDRPHELRAELARGLVQLSVDPSIEAGVLLEEAVAAIPVFEEHGDERALGRTWLEIANLVGSYHCRYLEAEKAAREALIHYRLAGWPFAACLAPIAGAQEIGPTPVAQALGGCRELLEEADLNGRAVVLPPLAALTAATGDFDGARELVRRSKQIRADLGQSIAWEYGGRGQEAQIEVMAGNFARAQESLEEGCRVLEQVGERAYLATRRAMLADVLYHRGLYERATELARLAQSGSTSDDIVTEWLWRSVEARLAARVGDTARADELINAALQMLASTDAVIHRGTCLLDAAEVFSLTDRSDKAADAIQEALRLFEKKGDQVRAARARSLLSSDRGRDSPQ
jgi:DNA-binding SARP family transcriptional activator/tetratricopeptide (TPR) repeat protein